MILDSVTGDFFWVTDYNSAGQYKFWLKAYSDSKLVRAKLFDSTEVTINVNNTDRPPVFESISDIEISETDSAIINLNAADPDGEIVTYSMFGDTTSAMKLVDSTGVFTWETTYEDSGSYDISFVASSGNERSRAILSDTVVVNIKVNNIDRAPVINEITDISIFEGDSLNIAAEAVDADNDSITYSVTGDISDSLKIDTKTGVITWATTNADSGIYKLNVIASSGTDSMTKLKGIRKSRTVLADTTSFILTVLDKNAKPVIDSIPDISFEEDESDSLELENYASDFDQDKSTLKYDVEIKLHESVLLRGNKGKRTIKRSGSRVIYGYRLEDTDLQVTVDTLSHMAKFTSSQDSSGQFEVVFKATDDSLAFDTDTILVNVLPVNDRPEMIKLLSPDSAAVVNKIVDFVWSSSSDIENDSLSYILRLFNNEPDSLSSSLDSLISLTDTTITFDGESLFVAGQKYFWQVSVTDQKDTVTTDTMPFKIKTWEFEAFKLLSPDSAASNIERNIDFYWQTAGIRNLRNGATYKLRIYENEADSSLFTTIDTGTDTTYYYRGDSLTWKEDYYWTVTAYNNNDSVHAANGKWKFTVRDEKLPYKVPEELDGPNVLRSGVAEMNKIKFRVNSEYEKIKIFTRQGRFVRELKKENGAFVWYGKDKKGRKLGSGAYIYQITSVSKVIANGLIAIIR